MPFTLAPVLFQAGNKTTDDAAAIAIAVAIYWGPPLWGGACLPFVLQKNSLQPLY